jgi:hypothetical protein
MIESSCGLVRLRPFGHVLYVAQALRTCPLCRTTTHFITPSTTWPETPADKEAIVDAYKASMADKVSSSSGSGSGSGGEQQKCLCMQPASQPAAGCCPWPTAARLRLLLAGWPIAACQCVQQVCQAVSC